MTPAANEMTVTVDYQVADASAEFDRVVDLAARSGSRVSSELEESSRRFAASSSSLFADYAQAAGQSYAKAGEAAKTSLSQTERELGRSLASGRLKLDSFAQAVIQDLTRLAVAGAGFGAAASSGSVMDHVLGSMISSISSASGLSGRATGGPVQAGEAYVVGERGQELFVPSQSGRILDNAESRRVVGSSSPNVNIQIIDQRTSGSPVQVQETRGGDNSRQIRVLIRDEVRAGIARGEYDTSLGGSFGIKRRGGLS